MPILLILDFRIFSFFDADVYISGPDSCLPPISLRPPRIIPPLQLLLLAIARSVHPAGGNGVREAERDGGAAHHAPHGEELAAELLPPPQGEQRVRPAGGHGDARAVDLETLQVRVAGEQEDRHEE